MIENRTKKIKNPAPFIAPYSDIPATTDEIKKRKKQRQEAEKIGASITKVTDDEIENPYRVKALVLISQNKPVPKELKEQIIQFDEKFIQSNEKVK
jgi:hypothetical protein